MLDAGVHQAAGLCALNAQQAPRFVALASHGDRRSELPLLWQLCGAWSTLGYPVVVLDATVTETEQQPGLQQLLHDSDAMARIAQGPQNWPIVPAALGLAQAFPKTPDTQRPSGLQQLGALFHAYEIVLLYAPAPALASALPGSGVAPLLAVSASEAALLTAYHGLKQLLNIGKLRPTIVAVMDDSALATRVSGHSIGRNLQDCARDFLACEIPALTVCPTRAQDMHQLALRTLERAPQPAGWQAPPDHRRGAAHAARSH